MTDIQRSGDSGNPTTLPEVWRGGSKQFMSTIWPHWPDDTIKNARYSKMFPS